MTIGDDGLEYKRPYIDSGTDIVDGKLVVVNYEAAIQFGKIMNRFAAYSLQQRRQRAEEEAARRPKSILQALKSVFQPH